MKMSNLTVQLTGKEMREYIKKRFPKVEDEE